MKHTRSSAEIEIREAVVKRFRELWPDARIIHEMNVEGGSSRADVVAVQPDRLWICEIKSERDKLDRLAGQIKNFAPCCHGMIVAAHEKWTARGPTEEIHKPATKTFPAHIHYRTEPSLLEKTMAGCRRVEVWSYPGRTENARHRSWEAPYRAEVPWYHRMLLLLWADEIREVAGQHRVSCDQRTPAYKLAPELSRMLSGREIEAAVCQALRARDFAEADPPVLSTDAARPAKPNLYRQECML